MATLEPQFDRATTESEVNMGANMTLYCAPACDLTPARIKRVKQVVRAIPDEDGDLQELMALMGYDEPAEAKRRILKNCIESQYEDRDHESSDSLLSIPGPGRRRAFLV